MNAKYIVGFHPLVEGDNPLLFLVEDTAYECITHSLAYLLYRMADAQEEILMERLRSSVGDKMHLTLLGIDRECMVDDESFLQEYLDAMESLPAYMISPDLMMIEGKVVHSRDGDLMRFLFDSPTPLVVDPHLDLREPHSLPVVMEAFLPLEDKHLAGRVLQYAFAGKAYLMTTVCLFERVSALYSTLMSASACYDVSKAYSELLELKAIYMKLVQNWENSDENPYLVTLDSINTLQNDVHTQLMD